MIDRLQERLRGPWGATGGSILTAAGLAWSIARGSVVPALLFVALFAWSMFALRRLINGWQAASEKLREAASRIGEADFVRPALAEEAPLLDAVAAQMAARHDVLRRRLDRGVQAEETVNAVFQALYGPAILVDACGNVQKLNRSALLVLQISEEQAIGRPFLQVLRDHRIDEALAVSLAQASGAALDVDVIAAARPARYRVRIEPILIGGEGKLIGAAILLFDVTRLRYLEKVRSEFVANVSHELRTPITSIKGFIETVLDDDVPEETRRRFLEIAKNEADRMETLIGDLLGLSRLESDTAPITREDIALEQLASEIIEKLRPQADRKRITPEVRIPPGLPPVPANRDMLGQALMNLLDNAIKYTQEGGQVWIEARRVAGDYVEICVCDNGPGIPSEHLPRVFERFYRVDKARSRAEGGTGLGLSIVRHIVQRHGGSVRAESRLGKGSRFIVTLPLNPQQVILPEWEG